eukprot:CAMPEP_0181331840 /NCGR_PEP_ID=MMETSP1101-20121128/24744_1 /TAXON_ID=46948 /ORGANISM="Rhodomonas abbreviata, Strain Caron Lab Isolate" /LENGTH=215 /DNA_ID=CAMNT_0023441383 /DNA_START=119 /DNA_END=766 /DNA_ORIENTATION=-
MSNLNTESLNFALYPLQPVYPSYLNNTPQGVQALNRMTGSVTTVNTVQPAQVAHLSPNLMLVAPGIQEVQTTIPSFVASPATYNAPGDAIIGSAVAYPPQATPMPYQQLQMVDLTPMPQTKRNEPDQPGMDPNIYYGQGTSRAPQATPQSQAPRFSVPACDPSIYMAAIEAGYAPSAYNLSDTSLIVDPNLPTTNFRGHAQHPHIRLMEMMKASN